jgi:hypothetical protein
MAQMKPALEELVSRELALLFQLRQFEPESLLSVILRLIWDEGEETEAGTFKVCGHRISIYTAAGEE